MTSSDHTTTTTNEYLTHHGVTNHPQQEYLHNEDQQEQQEEQQEHLLDNPEHVRVMNIVQAYFVELFCQLKSHLVIEQKWINEGRIEFRDFYRNRLSVSLQRKLEACPDVQEEYDSLIQQAKFHLFKMYFKELKALHDSSKASMRGKRLNSLFDRDHAIIRKAEPDMVPSDDEDDEDDFLFFFSSEVDQIQEDEQDERANQQQQVTVSDVNERGQPSDVVVDLYDIVQPKEQVHVPLSARIYHVLCKVFPFLIWIPEYRHHLVDLKSDILAGITVGIMLIPQGMAYALLIGLPAIYGLYASFIPLIIYALLGTSKHMSNGPTAVSALALASALQQLSTKPEMGGTLYIQYALLFGVVVGLMQVAFGAVQLGFLVNFLSYPVISGFTSAAAILIALSQLNSFLGTSMPSSNGLHNQLVDIVDALPDIHYPTLLFSVCCIAFLFIFEKVYVNLGRDRSVRVLKKNLTFSKMQTLKKVPGSLALVFVGILALYLVKVIGRYDSSKNDVFGIRIVGFIPPGPPSPGIPRVPSLNGQLILEILQLAFPVAFVGVIEGYSISKFYAMQKGYELNANQELVAIGMANFVGALFRAFPVTGSISRTPVNANSGAKTQLAGIISALTMLLTLWILTPLFYYLPMPLLASIIIYSCSKIIDVNQARFTYRTKARDLIVLLVAFFCTLFIGLVAGILIAAAVSVVFVLLRSMRPRFSQLGRIPGTHTYNELKKWKNAHVIPGILIMRFDADLYFANASYFISEIKRSIQQSVYPIFVVVVDWASISQCDSTTISTLEDINSLLQKQDIALYLASVKKTIRIVLKRGGIYQKLDTFDDVHSAVIHAEHVIHKRIVEAQKKQREEEANEEQEKNMNPSSNGDIELSERSVSLDIREE